MSRLYLPIFPLPDVAFFPHTVLPLHVFEARYRAMVSDCLARDRRLALVGLKPGYEDHYEGKPGVHHVAGAGAIIRCERLATGRYNMLVRGDCRVRLEREVPTDTLYRVAEASVLEETGANGPRVATLAGEVKNLCRRVLRAVNRSSVQLLEALDGVASPGVLCDQIAAALVPGPVLRQRLLEEPDVERRLTRLSATLGGLLRQLEG